MKFEQVFGRERRADYNQGGIVIRAMGADDVYRLKACWDVTVDGRAYYVTLNGNDMLRVVEQHKVGREIFNRRLNGGITLEQMANFMRKLDGAYLEALKK